MIGSESPNLYGTSNQIFECFCKEYSVKQVINLTAQEDVYRIAGIRYEHIPIEYLPSIEQMDLLKELIDNSIDKSEAVLIHCQKGIDRTGAVVGAYLTSIGYNPELVISRLIEQFSKQMKHPNLKKLWNDSAQFILSYAKKNNENSIKRYDYTRQMCNFCNYRDAAGGA